MNRHNKNIISFITIGLIISSSLFAVSGKMIVDVDEKIYNEIDTMYSLQDKVKPSTSRPWTLDEMNYYIDKIDTSNLTKVENTLYSNIITSLNDLDTSYGIGDYTRVSTNVDLTAQAFMHTNNTDDEYSVYSGWAENNLDYRKSLFNFEGSFSYQDSLYWFMSLEYGNSKFYNISLGTSLIDGYYNHHTDAVISIYDNDTDVDIYSPKYDPYYSALFSNNLFDSNRDLRAMGPFRNYIALGNSPLTFAFARTKLSFGNSIVGNLLLDESQLYYDYTNLSYYDEAFKVSWLNVFFDTQTSHDQIDSYNGMKIMMLTRFEVKILPKLVFSFTDTMMYEPSTLSFSTLNPAYFFHNLNNREVFNASALFDFNYQVSKGLSLYFNLMVDQLALSGENSIEPSAIGIEIGGEKIFELDESLLNLKFETGFISPQMYTRDYVDYKMATRYYTNGSYKTSETSTKDLYYVSYLSYIGFPYGADSIYAKIEANYDSLKEYSLSVSYLILLKGPTVITDLYKDTSKDNTTIFPLEINKIKNIVTLSGSYDFNTKYPMSIYGDLSFVDAYYWTSHTHDFDVELNLTYKITI